MKTIYKVLGVLIGIVAIIMIQDIYVGISGGHSVLIPTQTDDVELITLSGTGQEATSKFSLEKGLSIFRMTHDGNSNFAVWLLDNEGNKVNLLANEIGDFDGSKAVGISKSGIYLLNINADGNWEISIE